MAKVQYLMFVWWFASKFIHHDLHLHKGCIIKVLTSVSHSPSFYNSFTNIEQPPLQCHYKICFIEGFSICSKNIGFGVDWPLPFRNKLLNSQVLSFTYFFSNLFLSLWSLLETISILCPPKSSKFFKVKLVALLCSMRS